MQKFDNTSETDVAPWGCKWDGWHWDWDGIQAG